MYAARRKGNLLPISELLKHGIFYLLLLYMFGLSASEGSFEDADKSNDFSFQSHQHYDLRHTIPGEPNIDYPIYSTVPTTSFSCAGKHEGYYADIESRCQAFRICTNTVRHAAGFGFLCPNGTLFSQRHFVCDWYRNVRCEESEQFYNKNAHNHITNHYEMMETVRQMIEYPMKTASKALAQKPATTKVQTPRAYAAQVKTAPQPTVVSLTPTRQTTATRPRENMYGTSSPRASTANVLRVETPTASSITQNSQDVYVNRFGELSTDPGSKFDAKTARIIAKPDAKSGRALNYAESINFGLNEYFPPANRNQKQIKNQIDVNSNVSNLRHAITAELNAKKPVHRSTSSQESTANANFNSLSHGFSKSKQDFTKFSKQTAASQTKYSTLINDTHIQPTDVTVDSLFINSFFDIPDTPIDDGIEYANATEVEELYFQDALEKNSSDGDEVEIHFKSLSSTTNPTTTTTTTTTEENRETTTIMPETTTEISNVETLPLIKTSLDNDSTFVTDLHLVENMLDNEEVTPKTTTSTTTTTTTTTTAAPAPSTPPTETIQMQTSTEMMMSVKMVETRVRGNRRQNSSYNRTTTLRPIVRRPQLSQRNATDTTSELSKERQHHHHHHHHHRHHDRSHHNHTHHNHTHHHHSHHHSRHRARTTNTTTTTTTVAPDLELNIVAEVSENDAGRKLSVRNIESTSVARGNSLSSADNKKSKANVRYSNINNQRRRTTTTTKTTTSTTIKPTRNRQNVIRPRGSQTYQRVSRTTSTTTTTATKKPSTSTTTTTTTTESANSVENIIGQNIEIIPLNVNEIDSSPTTSSSTTTTTLAPTTSISSPIATIPSTTDTYTNNTTNDNVENLLPFNELTRAIVDESILQNYRSYPSQQKQYKPPFLPVVPQFPATPTASTTTPHVFPQGPNIIIASAEGGRLDTTSRSKILPQPKATESSHSYESLNEFLNKKFGQAQTSAKPTTHYYATNPKNVFNTQQQQQYITPRQPQAHFPINLQQQQQHTKHIVYAQPAQHQQIYPQSSILKNYQQQTTFYNNYRQPQQATSAYRNIKLPTLNDGIIPAAYTPTIHQAQRRLDTFNFELESSTLPRTKLFSGVSSYDVPLSSVGRLPNDKSQRLQRH